MYNKKNANDILKDKRIKPVQRLIVREIVLLADRPEGCKARNIYFQNAFGVSTNTVISAHKIANELDIIFTQNDGHNRVSNLSKFARFNGSEPIKKSKVTYQNLQGNLSKFDMQPIKKSNPIYKVEEKENKNRIKKGIKEKTPSNLKNRINKELKETAQDVKTHTESKTDFTNPIEVQSHISEYFGMNKKKFFEYVENYYPKIEKKKLTNIGKDLSLWFVKNDQRGANTETKYGEKMIWAQLATFLQNAKRWEEERRVKVKSYQKDYVKPMQTARKENYKKADPETKRKGLELLKTARLGKSMTETSAKTENGFNLFLTRWKRASGYEPDLNKLNQLRTNYFKAI